LLKVVVHRYLEPTLSSPQPHRTERCASEDISVDMLSCFVLTKGWRGTMWCRRATPRLRSHRRSQRRPLLPQVKRNPNPALCPVQPSLRLVLPDVETMPMADARQTTDWASHTMDGQKETQDCVVGFGSRGAMRSCVAWRGRGALTCSGREGTWPPSGACDSLTWVGPLALSTARERLEASVAAAQSRCCNPTKRARFSPEDYIQ
jgi:hypothetical protein